MDAAAADNRRTVRALQLGQSIDLKGLEREDAVSKNPLAFRVAGSGLAVLFRSGAAAFIGLSPLEEEDIVRSLEMRISGAHGVRDSETARIIVDPSVEDGIASTGDIQLRTDDSARLLLVAEAVADSAALSADERRIAEAFDRIEPVMSELAAGRLPPGPRAELLARLGEVLQIQQRLSTRLDLVDKPDILWDRPELERLWARLVDEYDLVPRARAIGRKLDVIRETTSTLGDLIATRTSHRLELWIIGLIVFEIVLSLAGRIWR
jgi:uncharacterized Rmd1/YagE family protein